MLTPALLQSIDGRHHDSSIGGRHHTIFPTATEMV